MPLLQIANCLLLLIGIIVDSTVLSQFSTGLAHLQLANATANRFTRQEALQLS